ncbi:MAG: hypothetical protein HY671_14945 [Chloroflexi bacterium]|nr:hypothetical protein [Chloroflexota bacterium]
MKTKMITKLAVSLALALLLVALAGTLARPALADPAAGLAEPAALSHQIGSCGGYQQGFQMGYADGLKSTPFSPNNRAVFFAYQGCGREFLTGYMAGNNQGSLQVQMQLTPGFQQSLQGMGALDSLLPMPPVLDFNQGWGAFGSTLGSAQNWNWHDTGIPPVTNYGSGYSPNYGTYDYYSPSGGYFGDGSGSGGYSPNYGTYDVYSPSQGYFGDGSGSGGYSPSYGYYNGYSPSEGYY